ncbi:MAG: hypothetical protein KTR32_21655 [Granulosicoccus sp.]|nr:hypothetical protein [Granulosicoccus sp.]
MLHSVKAVTIFNVWSRMPTCTITTLQCCRGQAIETVTNPSKSLFIYRDAAMLADMSK